MCMLVTTHSVFLFFILLFFKRESHNNSPPWLKFRASINFQVPSTSFLYSCTTPITELEFVWRKNFCQHINYIALSTDLLHHNKSLSKYVLNKVHLNINMFISIPRIFLVDPRSFIYFEFKSNFNLLISSMSLHINNISSIYNTK